MKKLVDLSHWNHYPIGSNVAKPYDYDLLVQYTDGVILKCSDPEVPGGHDEFHAQDFDEFKSRGMPVGEYLFYDPSTSPRDQIGLFVTHSKVGFLDALDVEDQENATLAGLTLGVINCLKELAYRRGRLPWLYSNLDYLDNRLLESMSGLIAGVWLAWPAPNSQTFPSPKKYDRSRIGIWQRSWVQPIPGTPRGKGDYNEWQWGDAEWAKLVGTLPKWDGMTEEARWALMKKIALNHNLAS